MNKKSMIAIVAVLAYIGSTLYISINIESKTKNILTPLQKKYADLGIDLQLIFKEKSFFGSKIVLTLDAKTPAQKKIIERYYTLPMQLNYDVEYGPILFKNGLGFGFAGVHAKQVVNSLLADWIQKELEKQEQKLILTSHSIVGFTKNVSTTIHMAPFVYKDEKLDLFFESSEIVGHSTINIETMLGKSNLEIASLRMSDFAKTKKKFLAVENTLLNIDITSWIRDDLYLGEFTMAAKNIQYINGTPNINFTSKAKIEVNINEDKAKDLRIDYDINLENMNLVLPKDSIDYPISNHDISFNMYVAGISPEGIKNFTDHTQKMENDVQMILNTDVNDTQAMAKYMANQEKSTELFFDVAQGIFSPKKAKLGYALKFSKEGDDLFEGNIDLAYLGDKLTGSVPEIIETFKKKLFDTVTVNIGIKTKESFVEALKNTRFKNNEKEITMGIEKGMAEGIILKEADSYKINVDYKQNKLIFNDKDKSLFLPLLKGLMQQ